MLNRSLFVKLLLGSLMAYTPLMACDANLARSTTPATFVKQSSTAPAKMTTMQVEGTSQPVPLSSVQTGDLSTYFPTDRFTLEQDKNSPNAPPTLYWKKPDGTLDRNTFIGFLFYGKVNYRDAKEFVYAHVQLGDYKGVRTITQSPVIDDAKRAYSSWLRDVIQVEGKSNGTVTTAYIGEVNGEVFVVLSSYHPPQYEDEFTAREAVVLRNLKIAKTNGTL